MSSSVFGLLVKSNPDIVLNFILYEEFSEIEIDGKRYVQFELEPVVNTFKLPLVQELPEFVETSRKNQIFSLEFTVNVNDSPSQTLTFEEVKLIIGTAIPTFANSINKKIYKILLFKIYKINLICIKPISLIQNENIP